MVSADLSDPSRYARGHAYADAGLFDGEGVPLTPTNADPVVRAIERRAALAMARPAAHCEPFSVIRYLPGQQYKPHVDYFVPEQLALNRERFGDFAGQRLATFLIYLRAPTRGGGTRFIDAGLTVTGETGSMSWIKDLTEITHSEFRDDRFVAAFTDQAAKVAYVVRAVAPGRYILPGTTVEDMYHPTRFARTGAGRLEIVAQ